MPTKPAPGKSTLPTPELFPITAGTNARGHITIGGCDLAELASEYGTPLYVYDDATVRHMCREFTGAFKKEYANSRVSYSSKAFASPALAKVIQEEGLGMDVVTGGELAVAAAAGFPPERMNFHGNNKSRRELEEALDYGIGHITIDSFHEIGLLDDVARAKGVRQTVTLRVSPSIDPHTHLLTTTGVLDSKFGFSIETGAADEAVKKALAAKNLDVAGLHFHLGSPIFELEPYSQAIAYVLEFAAKMRKKYGFKLREFNPGGGMAIGYIREKLPPPVAAYAHEVATAIRAGCDAHGLHEPALTVEPGRAIVGRAGVAVYTVGGIKDIPGVRTYVCVDGGMGDNIRPALYGAKYTVAHVRKPSAAATKKVTIAGKFCESGDVLAKDVMVPDVQPGDLLALPASGAYCVPMASNYNMTSRPAIVMVKDGQSRLIRRRETYADLLATSVM
jgi:diaminopimelate decarboxylase